MGEIVKYNCDCGYETGDLSIGCGFNSFDYDSEDTLSSISSISLCYCHNCEIITRTETVGTKTLFEQLKNKKKRTFKYLIYHFLNWLGTLKPNCCPECGNIVSFFINGMFCPKCKSDYINEEEVGCWD